MHINGMQFSRWTVDTSHSAVSQVFSGSSLALLFSSLFLLPSLLHRKQCFRLPAVFSLFQPITNNLHILQGTSFLRCFEYAQFIQKKKRLNIFGTYDTAQFYYHLCRNTHIVSRQINNKIYFKSDVILLMNNQSNIFTSSNINFPVQLLTSEM